jgi:hypothetical protein
MTKTRSPKGPDGGPARAFLVGFLILMGLALLVGALTVLFP